MQRLQSVTPRSQSTVAATALPNYRTEPDIAVSVCIVNWNCRELLRECLLSLLHAPQGVSLEVIVVDNASTDGAAGMVTREFPQVRLIRNTANAGFAAANNQAARHARGAYLFFLNNDTVVPSYALGHLLDFLEAHPDVALVGPRLVGSDGRSQRAHRKQPTVAAFLHRIWLFRLTGLFRARYRAYRRSLSDPEWPCEVEMLLGAAVLVARRRFEDIGGWDEEFTFGGEDLDLCLRARRHGPIVYCPHVAVTHVGSASTKANIAYASPHIAAGYVRYFRKAGAAPGTLLLYKLAVTLDAPLRLVVKSIQYVLRRCRGRSRSAAKSLLGVRSAAAFLRRGLIAFWKA
jgi:GT2 family glycosyltransferase